MVISNLVQDSNLYPLRYLGGYGAMFDLVILRLTIYTRVESAIDSVAIPFSPALLPS